MTKKGFVHDGDALRELWEDENVSNESLAIIFFIIVVAGVVFFLGMF